jgi:inner membrane protein YidH
VIKNYADHSANERTFLAWVRTVIAIEGFGLVAARLSNTPTQIWSEITLLSTGGLVLALAFVRMRHIRRHIDAQKLSSDGGLFADALLLVLIAAMFALIGTFGLHVW